MPESSRLIVRRGLRVALALGFGFVPAALAATPKYRIIKHVSLETRTQEPTFVALSHPRLLDRGRLLKLGRPFGNRSSFIALDLQTLEEHLYQVPDIEGPWVPTPDQFVVDEPAYYDTDLGSAGLVLREGGKVSGGASWAEWDLKANRIVNRLPLAPANPNAWTGVEAFGFDPDRKETFIELHSPAPGRQEKPCQQAGPYDLTILAVTDRVRTVANFKTALRYTGKSPYFDPIHRRSMHVEYAECEGEETTAYLVDLDSGSVKKFPLPKIIYGFAFDPDGRTGYAYTEPTGEVFTLDLESGAIGRRRAFGRRAHLLSWIGPHLLCLGRNAGMHFIDPKTLKQVGFIDTKTIHKKGSTHLEGSTFVPGRAIVRNFRNVYVLDFPTLKP